MGSNYFGDQNYFGNERGRGLSSSSSSSTSSSRKGKKNGSDKPKQPQRGLGVAQLERMRLEGQLRCDYHPSVHNPYAPNFSQEEFRMQTVNSSSSFSYSSSSSPRPYGFQGSHVVMMGLPDSDMANVAYRDSNSSSITRWNASIGTQQFVEPRATTSLFESSAAIQGSIKKKKKERNDLMVPTSQNSESSSSQDIDLELRL